MTHISRRSFPPYIELRSGRHRATFGEDRWVLDNRLPRFAPNGFAGYIGSCIDISDRIASE